MKNAAPRPTRVPWIIRPTYRHRSTGHAVLVSAVIGVAAFFGFGGVAWAHAAGLTTSASEPVVVGLTPPVPGLTVRPVEFGARMQLVNDTASTVEVQAPPGDVRAALLRVPPGGRAYWYDPRIAGAANADPGPDRRRPWAIPLSVGETPVTVLGEQRWPPPPNPLPWWAITALAAVLPGVLVALGARPHPGTFSRVVLAVSTAVVMVAHVVHIWGSSLVPEEGAFVWVFLGAAGFAVVGWPLGVAGAWLTLRGRAAGALLCCVSGALLAIIIAPADVFSFHDAVVPFDWGADLDRLLIALTVGGGLGVLAAAWLTIRRLPPSDPTADVDGSRAAGETP